MLRKLIAYIWIFIAVPGSVSGEVVQQSDIYKLDLTSVKLVLNRVQFSYIYKEVDVNSKLFGITASCSNGKIVSSRPGWTIENTEELVLANTKDRLNFLTLVCKRSIVSKTEA